MNIGEVGPARLSAAGGVGAMMRNAGYILAAEGAARVTRIGAALALAWSLTPALFGAAALIMTIAELMRAPTRSGVLQAVGRASDADLPATLATASRLNWIVHLGLGAAQAALAWPLALWMGAPEIAWPLIALALIYPLYPIVFPRVALLHREARMGAVARLMGISLSLANLLTAALALAGFGLWSVVLPRLASALAWVLLARRMHAAPEMTQPGDWRPIWRYGRAVLGTEMLKIGRLHLDKIIVGKLLGMEALGLYAFAFNAGLGLSLSALKGFSDALFPYLCAQSRAMTGAASCMRAQAYRAMGVALAAGTLLFGLQALAAQWYVPLLFGERWAAATLPLALLCLSAIPRPVWETASQILRAEGQPQVELPYSIAFTGLYLTAVAFGALAGGVVGAALACLVAHWLGEPVLAWRALHRPKGTLAHA